MPARQRHFRLLAGINTEGAIADRSLRAQPAREVASGMTTRTRIAKAMRPLFLSVFQYTHILQAESGTPRFRIVLKLTICCCSTLGESSP